MGGRQVKKGRRKGLQGRENSLHIGLKGETQEGTTGALSSMWLEQRVCKCMTESVLGEVGEEGRAFTHIRARLAQQSSPPPPTFSYLALLSE